MGTSITVMMAVVVVVTTNDDEGVKSQISLMLLLLAGRWCYKKKGPHKIVVSHIEEPRSFSRNNKNAQFWMLKCAKM